jgi:hypothetical protein
MAGRERPGTIELFRKQDAGKPMRQGQPGQGPAKIGALQAICRYAIGTTDYKNQVLTNGLPLIETACEFFARKLRTALIENDNKFSWLDLRQYLRALCDFGSFGCRALVALRRAYRVMSKLPLTGQSLNVSIERRIDPGRLPVTDRLQTNVHS